MFKNSFKPILPTLAFIIFLIPIVTSSLLDLEQKRVNELMLEQERIQNIEQKKIYLTGKFNPAYREDFVLVPSSYVADNMSKANMYLRKETFYAYLQMKNAADLDFIALKIASATRNFDSQKEIWNNKWTEAKLVEGKNLSISLVDEQERLKKILEYSAVPGTSRHHWGTDIDINTVNLQYFETEKGKREYEWLTKNAYLFGFCQTYNLKGSIRPTGYNQEKWHWSYLPLAKVFTQEYKDLIKDEDIKGFNGDEYVPSLNLINDYILSANPDCV